MEALHAGPATSTRLPERVRRMSRDVRTCAPVLRPDRKYSSYGRCADCEYLGRCHVCPLACAPLAEWPDERRVPDFLCAFNRVALECRDRFPCQPELGSLLRGRPAARYS